MKIEENQSKELAQRVDGESDDVRRERVIRLAFQNDADLFQEFCEIISSCVPPSTSVVLRGSAVTGERWADGAPFDADGPGTSDLDLTLIGNDVINLYSIDGFFVPLVHSRPLSDKDPDIAPDLVPLRERLQSLVKRPVNIQATRDFVMFIRGDVLGQPYLSLIEKAEET